jgi:hypothetical protein
LPLPFGLTPEGERASGHFCVEGDAVVNRTDDPRLTA